MANTVSPRLRAAGADMSRVTQFAETVNQRLGKDLPSFPKDLPHLEKLIDDQEAGLVIIDPFMAFLSGETDTHRDGAMRRFLFLMADLAGRTRSAILLVRHLNKTSGMQAMYRGGGSIGIIGSARSGLMVGRDPRAPSAVDTFLLAVTKQNLAERAPSIRYRIREQDGVSSIEWLGHAIADVDEMVGRPLLGQVQAIDYAIGFLMRALAKGPQPAAEIASQAQAARVATSTLRRARMILGVVTKPPASFGGGWTWELPEQPVLAVS